MSDPTMPDAQLPQTAYLYRPTTDEGAVADWTGPAYPANPTSSFKCLVSPLPFRDEALVPGIFDAERMLMFTKPTADVIQNDRVIVDGVSYKVDGPVTTLRNPAAAWAPHHKEATLMQEDK